MAVSVQNEFGLVKQVTVGFSWMGSIFSGNAFIRGMTMKVIKLIIQILTVLGIGSLKRMTDISNQPKKIMVLSVVVFSVLGMNHPALAISYDECEKLGFAPGSKAASLCRAYEWGNLESGLKRLLCVGYSSSVCFKPEEQQEVVKLFKTYPETLEKAAEAVKNSNDIYHAANLTKAFQQFVKKHELAIEGGVEMDKAGSNTLYDSSKLVYLGSFPAYLHKDTSEVVNQCKYSGGVPLDINMVKSHLDSGNIKSPRGDSVVLVDGDKLIVRGLLSPADGKSWGSWGNLFCEIRKDLEEYTKYAVLEKMTFADTQKYCTDQNKFLPTEREAKARIRMIVSDVSNNKVELKEKRSGRYIPHLYMAYANSQYDYGYVITSPGGGTPRVKPCPFGKRA